MNRENFLELLEELDKRDDWTTGMPWNANETLLASIINELREIKKCLKKN